MLLAFLFGCATHFRPPGPLAPMGEGWVARHDAPRSAAPGAGSDPAEGPGATVVATACRFIGQPRIVLDGVTYRQDCSGLVEAALAAAGYDFAGSSAMLFEAARDAGVLHRRRLPFPGDVAFFDDTYDRNGNGRRDDPLSHVAVVEAVAEDGTITLVHVGSKGVVRFRMNLRRPEERSTEGGVVLNDYLRARTPGDGPRTRYLAGELWVGFASFWRLAPSAAPVALTAAATPPRRPE